MFNILNAPIITSLLSVLIGSLVLYYLQTKLSERVINNFQASKTWIPENELVLLTGGFVTLGDMVDYACSKASALAFQEGLRQELKYWYKAPNVRTRLVGESLASKGTHADNT